MKWEGRSVKIGLSDVRFISSIQVENSSDKCTAERERANRSEWRA